MMMQHDAMHNTQTVGTNVDDVMLRCQWLFQGKYVGHIWVNVLSFRTYIDKACEIP